MADIHHSASGWLRFCALAFLGCLGGAGGVNAEPRTWTSVNGAVFEAEYIAKVGSEHWLRKGGGGLLKFRLAELSPGDVEFIRAALAGPTARADGTGWILVMERPEGRSTEMLETLLRTSIPSIQWQGTPMRAALGELSGLVAEVASERGSIEFRIHPECRDAKSNMSLHNISAWTVLQLVATDARVRVVFHADHIEILPPAVSTTPDFIPTSS